jgi:hypothetical protein
MPNPSEMIIAAVYSSFINELPLYVSTVRALKHWDLDEGQIWQLGIRPCPTFEVNEFVSAECFRRYGDRLGEVAGFFSIDRPCANCEDCEFCKFRWTADCICARKTWRADIDPRLAANGLLVPERNRSGLILRLWVYRWHGDRRPFPLAIRREAVAA